MTISPRIIKVGKVKVGILGLEEAIKEVESRNLESDDDIGEFLLNTLRTKNYIPSSSASDYKKAFLNEYKKYKGQPVTENYETPEIKVLGPGCYQCDLLAKKVKKLLGELDISADFDQVKDIREFAQYGVMTTPALIINGKMKCMGKVPPDKQLKNWIEELK